VSLSLLQTKKQRNESSGSSCPSSSCPGSAVPPAQSDTGSGPCSPNTPPDTPRDVPKARPSVFSRLSRMPAPTSQASTDQVGTQHLLGPNRHNVNLPRCVSLYHVSSVPDRAKSITCEQTMCKSDILLLPYDDLHAALGNKCHCHCYRPRSRGMKAVAAVVPLAAVPAQQSHQLSQTQAVGPAALTPPLTLHLMCPKLAPVSFLGSAACLPPQARRLLIRWVFNRVLDSAGQSKEHDMSESDISLLPYDDLHAAL